MASGGLSRDDFRKQKALDEARKQGTVAPLLDESGKEINPHIPQYIAQAPWYVSAEGPSLKHQRRQAEKQDVDINTWYHRGARKAEVVTKFRKGACENCGAMTHKTKECCERPRKVGAKYTGKDIMPDEILTDVNLDFEGKRDRWNGYDSSAHAALMEKYDKAEMERRRLRKEEELNKFNTEPDAATQKFPSEAKTATGAKQEGLAADSDSDDDEDQNDENKEFLESDSASVGVKKDPKTRTTIRNLRIREDTAKYLVNLDVNSAHYDPKSRSMRGGSAPVDDSEFVKADADIEKFNEIQYYSWEAQRRTNTDVNIVAAPSQAELAFKEFKEKKDNLIKRQQEEILAKYGGKEHLESVPKELLISQTENFVEYAADGSVKGKDKKNVITSRYEEDVYINNHTSVWGSFWENGEWGYACCNSLIKNSYCVGSSGIDARKAIKREMEERTANKLKQDSEDAAEALKQAKKKETLKEEVERIKKMEKSTNDEKDDRKRGYNSFNYESEQVTEKDMEDYLLKKKRFDDPMNYMKDTTNQ